MKTIFFAGGCFWGTEHYIRQFDGVVETMTGYANGNVHDPAYEQVYTDSTGHVECVKVVYDSEKVSLATLCRFFFRSIDPLLKDRQGEDVGTRYRTGIYWTSEEDKAVVEYSMSIKSDASLDEVKDDVSKAIENKGVMALSILDSESVKGTRTMVTDLLKNTIRTIS